MIFGRDQIPIVLQVRGLRWGDGEQYEIELCEFSSNSPDSEHKPAHFKVSNSLPFSLRSAFKAELIGRKQINFFYVSVLWLLTSRWPSGVDSGVHSCGPSDSSSICRSVGKPYSTVRVVVINDASVTRIGGLGKYFFVAVNSFRESVSLESIPKPLMCVLFFQCISS